MKISTPIIVLVVVIVIAYFWLTSQTNPANDPSQGGTKTTFKGSGNAAINTALYGSGASVSADYLAANYPNLSGADVAKVKSMAESLNAQLYKPLPAWNDLIAQAKLVGPGAAAVKPYYNNRYGASINTLLTAWRIQRPLKISKINELNNLLG